MNNFVMQHNTRSLVIFKIGPQLLANLKKNNSFFQPWHYSIDYLLYLKKNTRLPISKFIFS